MAFLFYRLRRRRRPFFSRPSPVKPLAAISWGGVELCGNLMSGKAESRVAESLCGVHKNRPAAPAPAQ